MAIISSRGVASLKKLYLELTDQEKQDLISKYQAILNKTALDLSRDIFKEQELQEDINNLMRSKFKDGKIDKKDFYIFEGEYGENLVYFLDKILKTHPAQLIQDANSPVFSGLKDRLLQPGRHKWLIFSLLAVTLTSSLGVFIPALIPIMPILISVAAGLAVIAAIWFYSGSSDNTTKLAPKYEKELPKESVEHFNKYLSPQSKSPQIAPNSPSVNAHQQQESLVTVSTNQPPEPSVTVSSSQQQEPSVTVSSNRPS
jgi:hypothetical protein